MSYVVSANRAGDALLSYIRRWSFELNDEVKGKVLDLSINRDVDELCRRIATDPDLPIDKEPIALRANLHVRLMVCLANAAVDPEAEVLSLPAEPTDRQVLTGVIGELVSKVRPPRNWNGKKLDR